MKHETRNVSYDSDMKNLDKLIVYRRADGDWGWCVKAGNGRIIATSGEGFKRKGHAVDIASRVTGLNPIVHDEKV